MKRFLQGFRKGTGGEGKANRRDGEQQRQQQQWHHNANKTDIGKKEGQYNSTARPSPALQSYNEATPGAGAGAGAGATNAHTYNGSNGVGKYDVQQSLNGNSRSASASTTMTGMSPQQTLNTVPSQSQSLSPSPSLASNQLAPVITFKGVVVNERGHRMTTTTVRVPPPPSASLGLSSGMSGESIESTSSSVILPPSPTHAEAVNVFSTQTTNSSLSNSSNMQAQIHSTFSSSAGVATVPASADMTSYLTTPTSTPSTSQPSPTTPPLTTQYQAHSQQIPVLSQSHLETSMSTLLQDIPQTPSSATAISSLANANAQAMPSDSVQVQNDITRNLVKKFIADIWNRGEIDLIPQVCSSHLRFNGNTGFDRVGHDGLARMVATIRDSLDEYHCEIHSMVVENNKAFCRLRFTGKHTGPLLGYQPTHKVVAWMGATEFTCQNGKILKVWELGDVKSLEEQLMQDVSSPVIVEQDEI